MIFPNFKTTIIKKIIYLFGFTFAIVISYMLFLNHSEKSIIASSSSDADGPQLQPLSASHPIEKPRIISNSGGGSKATADVQQLAANNESPIINILLEKYNEIDVKTRIINDKINRLTAKNDGRAGDTINNNAIPVNQSTSNVHIFYSAPVNWYTTTSNETHFRGSDRTLEINSLNTIFYPMLGVYTINTKILEKHFQNIKKLGIRVVILTWRPNHSMDKAAGPTNIDLLKNILNFVKKYFNSEIQIAIEIDNYESRTADSIRNLLELFHREFIWSHPALYRVFVASKKQYLPMIYVRDAFQIQENDWFNLFSKNGIYSVRKTRYDGVFIGHISSKIHTSVIKRGQFDGFYTRLASNGATYSSTWKNWEPLKKSADKYNLIFIPTVGPGYNEKKKEPKFGGYRRHRSNGQYFGVAWRTAIGINAQFISISSYNDWPMGTQIEEAIPYPGCKDYQPTGPTKYLDLTRHWVNEYTKSKESNTLITLSCNEYFNNTVC